MPAGCRPRGGGPTRRGQDEVEGDDLNMVSERAFFCNTFQYLASPVPDEGDLSAMDLRWPSQIVACATLRRSWREPFSR
jgi:hypothetical protein